MNAISRALTRIFSARIPENKASATASVVAFHHVGQPVWSPRDYGALAREGYMRNAIVYRCVRMICEAAASVPIALFEDGRELTNHPLLKLLRCPNPAECGTDLLERWYGFLLVAGNSYLEAVRLDGEVRELYVLRPDRMSVIVGDDGWPQAYDYTIGGRATRFDQSERHEGRPILHLTYFHPVNDHYGFSPLEAAASAIDIHNAASSWNKALLDNAARPSGALVYSADQGHLTQDQFARLKSELEVNFQGAKNAGRPLLLEGGLDWKPMGFSPKEMDFIEAKHVAAREIALALGVPPMLIGIPGDNTYANYQEANRTFWRQTVLPLVTRTLDALAGWLASGSSARIELRANIERISALSSERETLWRRIAAADFLSEDEKRASVGYGPREGGA